MEMVLKSSVQTHPMNAPLTHSPDCVSFKPNSTNVLVQNMICNGTHGMSVGSLGQYPDRVDYVENIYVYNAAMYNSSEGARIKVWPNSFSEKSANLVGGGGTGLVRNVTYDTMWLDNVDYGLTITQCYGQDDEEECFKHPVRTLTFPLQLFAVLMFCAVETQHHRRHVPQHPRPHQQGLFPDRRPSGLLQPGYVLEHRGRGH